jgi:hypothetical protein
MLPISVLISVFFGVGRSCCPSCGPSLCGRPQGYPATHAAASARRPRSRDAVRVCVLPQIAVVAVMCKPHRCPHIAMTGNICVYCPGGPDSDFEYSTQSYTGYEVP